MNTNPWKKKAFQLIKSLQIIDRCRNTRLSGEAGIRQLSPPDGGHETVVPWTLNH